MKKFKIIFLLSAIYLSQIIACSHKPTTNNNKAILPAAYLTSNYIHILEDKKVAVVANHTSLIYKTHLVDSLVSLGINITKIFSPEHGFRGTQDAGAHINSNIDPKTNIPIISLYGKSNKPTKQHLKNIDYIIFDIQDVGVRFYTYISTLHYVMQACAENNIPIMVLDRPNPNGFYVDGPILQSETKSFIGMHPIPIVHGMTIGELAQMINEENWLGKDLKCQLTVIKCQNYTHNSLYKLPVKPSPNLPNMRSVYLYPSLGLFEQTEISTGRGTKSPFQIFGHPDFDSTLYKFKPTAIKGESLNPKFKDVICYGENLQNENNPVKQFTLSYLIKAYSLFPADKDFFKPYFYRIAGNKKLEQQIKSGLSEKEIRSTWINELSQFKEKREKYLLYADFE